MVFADLKIVNAQDLAEFIQFNKPYRPSDVFVCFIKRGSVQFKLNDKFVEIFDNCVFFSSSRYVYTLLSYSDDLEVYYMNVPSPFRTYTNLNFNRFDVYRSISENYSGMIYIPKNDFEYIWQIVDFMYYQLYKRESKVFLKELIANSYSALAYSIVGHLEKNVLESPGVKSRSEEKVLEFLDLVAQNFIKERELAFYADKLNVSLKYLSKLIKEITGHPPTYFITQLLIDASCNALGNKDLTIIQIAEMLGFADSFTFSKFFKRNVGLTPTEFRNNL